MGCLWRAGCKVQRNGLIFKSISDARTCRLLLSPKGVPELSTPNRMIFTAAIDAELSRAGQSYWYPQPDVLLPAKPAWVLNTCADADTFAQGLEMLDAAYPATVPVFNHPRAVLLARRDIAGQGLRGIPGLEVPKCRRFMANSPQSFAECFAQGAFTYPVTVQPSTARHGLGRVIIAHPLDWQTAFDMGLGGQQHLMVQAQPEDANLDWALRMVFVGRGGTVDQTRLRPQDGPADPVMPAPKDFVQGVFKAVIARMPLDFWTLDLAVVAPDRLRLLDVAAGLHIPAESDGVPLLRQQALQVTAHLAPRLLALLGDPARWREDARKLPTVAAMKQRYGA